MQIPYIRIMQTVSMKMKENSHNFWYVKLCYYLGSVLNLSKLVVYWYKIIFIAYVYCISVSFLYLASIIYEPSPAKGTIWPVHPSKTWISLHILIRVFDGSSMCSRRLNISGRKLRMIRLCGCAYWCQSSLYAHTNFYLMLLWNQDKDQNMNETRGFFL